eukprot:Gregarina_sp_Poly_1__8907@NODE_538_length_7624_cov_89_908694_g425_i0_p2_GENE_NODE_538_length_7624_cov_89_908694_g425_i0NODE_538_length_7624_cov_89_908694_g425_i0_p2_ORF_typecomplete_len443_score41_49_NODE_538_length_7624_cov_89_908694_g425_i09332261
MQMGGRQKRHFDPALGSRLLHAAFIFSSSFLLVLFLHSRNLFDSVTYYRDEVFHVPANSTVHRLLTRYPNSLNFHELHHKLSLDYFNRRSHLFKQRTQGLLKDEQGLAVAYNLCPGNGSKVAVHADKELGYTLESYLGQVYYLHLYDCLESSSGYEGSRAFFFFNPSHGTLEEGAPGTHVWDFRESFNTWNALARQWEKLPESDRSKYWNPVRTDSYPMIGLQWPPFHRFYHNTFMSKLKTFYNRPVAIVSGKHYGQWNNPVPMNSFAEPTALRPILDALLTNEYVVVYNRPRKRFRGDTDVNNLDPGDYDMIFTEYKDKDVITVEELWDIVNPEKQLRNDVLRFNLFQLLVYQQAEIFVDTQGGGAVLSSLMPGEHFILHVLGSEMISDSSRDLDKAWVYTRWWRHGGGRFFVYNDSRVLAVNLKGVAGSHRALHTNKAGE